MVGKASQDTATILAPAAVPDTKLHRSPFYNGKLLRNPNGHAPTPLPAKHRNGLVGCFNRGLNRLRNCTMRCRPMSELGQSPPRGPAPSAARCRLCPPIWNKFRIANLMTQKSKRSRQKFLQNKNAANVLRIYNLTSTWRYRAVFHHD